MKSSLRYLVVACTLALLVSLSTEAHAQLRSTAGTPDTMTRDLLVERMGLSPRQAETVIKIDRSYAESMRQAEDRHRLQVQRIREAEARELARIVGEERVSQVKRLVRPLRLRLPFLNRGEPSLHGPKLAPPEFPGSSLDLRWLRDWIHNLTDLTPEQSQKIKALTDRYREQLKTLQEGFRQTLEQILTSEQMQRFRSEFEEKKQQQNQEQVQE
jgi:hypothetical protein